MLSVLEAFAVQCSFKKWMTLVGRLRPDWCVHSGQLRRMRWCGLLSHLFFLMFARAQSGAAAAACTVVPGMPLWARAVRLVRRFARMATGDPTTIMEGRMSYISGHAAESMVRTGGG